MPISLRLPTDIEDQITGLGARQGLSKSAVIAGSIHEFLARNAQPSSFQIYEDEMHGGTNKSGDAASDAKCVTAEQRPYKILVRDAIRQKPVRRPKQTTAAAATRR